MKKVVVNDFNLGEIAYKSMINFKSERSDFGLTKCRNMITDSLSGVRSRPGSAKVKNITGRTLGSIQHYKYNHKGIAAILSITSNGLVITEHSSEIISDPLNIDLAFTSNSALNETRISQWGIYIIVTNKTAETRLINLDTGLASSLSSVPWSDNSTEAPNDSAFHVDRFVFISGGKIFGGNSSNNIRGKMPYEFQEEFTAEVTYNVEGVETINTDTYYSAASSFEAEPLSGDDTGFNWIVSGRMLLAGSNNGLWVLNRAEEAFSADTLYIKNISPNGTANIKAIAHEAGFFYFQADYQTFAYVEYLNDDPNIVVLNEFSKFLFEEFRPVKMVLSSLPDFNLWILREDGKVVNYRQNLVSEISAWTLHEFSGDVFGLETIRGQGLDKLMLFSNEGSSGCLLEVKEGNRFLDNYRSYAGTSIINEKKYLTPTDIDAENIGFIVSSSIYRVKSNVKILHKSLVDADTGLYSIPDFIGNCNFIVSDSYWPKDRNVDYDENLGSVVYTELIKTEGVFEQKTNINWKGQTVYFLENYNPVVGQGTEMITSESIVNLVRENGKYEIPYGLDNGVIGCYFDAYLEPRILTKLFEGKKSRIVSLAATVYETESFQCGDDYNKLLDVVLNTENGESFIGQTDKKSLLSKMQYLPSVIVKASRASNLHIISLYLEVE